jgi:hypothetical protein
MNIVCGCWDYERVFFLYTLLLFTFCTKLCYFILEKNIESKNYCIWINIHSIKKKCKSSFTKDKHTESTQKNSIPPNLNLNTGAL